MVILRTHIIFNRNGDRISKASSFPAMLLVERSKSCLKKTVRRLTAVVATAFLSNDLAIIAAKKSVCDQKHCDRSRYEH